MTKVTFSAQNVLSNEISTRSGNLAKKLFDMDNSLASNGRAQPPSGLGAEISETNPYGTPTEANFGSGISDGHLNAYLNQVRISSYYQQNPEVVLGVSARYNSVPLGGPIPARRSNSDTNIGSNVEYFTDEAPEEHETLLDLEEPEESQTEQLLYLIGSGIAFTGLIGISVALTYSQK